MGKRFITGFTEAGQRECGKWYTKHNQLFLDDDGCIYLAPRNEDIDGYSYPSGGRMAKWDIRPANGHDFECKYHQKILVKLTLCELINKGYLKNKNIDGFGIIVCKDIHPKYLEVQDTTFIETNARFKRMMESCNISAFWKYTMYAAVHLNVNWLKTGKEKFNFDNIYKLEN